MGAGLKDTVAVLGRADGGLGALLLGSDLVEDGGGGGLQLGSSALGVTGHAGSVGGHTHVGLLDLLGGLSTESELGTSLGSDGTGDHASDGALVAVELHHESTASESRASLGGGRAAHESEHLPLTGSDGETEVLLGDGSSGADGVHHLLLKLSAGSLGLEGNSLEGGEGLLGKAGHLGLKAESEGSLGLLVHGTARLEDGSSTLLTLLDGGAEGGLELSLVGLLEGSDELAARASLVLADDTSELGDGLVGLLVVLGNNLTEKE